MRGIGGLAALQLVGITRPFSHAPLPMGGAAIHKRFSATMSPPNLNNSGENSSVGTPWLTISPASKRRGAVYGVSWRQLSGLPGEIVRNGPLQNYFVHALPAYSTYPFSWRGTVYNQFGESADLEVTFNLTRYEPIPPLLATGTPNSQQLVPVDPVSRQAMVSFSVSVSSGVPPFTYDWVGGSDRYSASNSMSVYLPVDAPAGITVTPSCKITDGAGQTINVAVGPYFFYDGPPM